MRNDIHIKNVKVTVKDYVATETQTPLLTDLTLVLEMTTSGGKVIQKEIWFDNSNEYNVDDFDVTNQPITIEL